MHAVIFSKHADILASIPRGIATLCGIEESMDGNGPISKGLNSCKTYPSTMDAVRTVDGRNTVDFGTSRSSAYPLELLQTLQTLLTTW